MPNILEVHELSKKYGDFSAVRNVTFDIKEGEIFSLLGPNGAGKTTTISMLSTLYAPSSGEATIDGHSITREPMAVRQVIGIVPQELALYEDLTAYENLIFWGQMYGLGGKALQGRANEVLEQIGLSDKARNRVKTYSGRMKRRVNIGVGLLHKPRLLFMDEPTVGIDPQSRRANGRMLVPTGTVPTGGPGGGQSAAHDLGYAGNDGSLAARRRAGGYPTWGRCAAWICGFVPGGGCMEIQIRIKQKQSPLRRRLFQSP
jgi:ABC-type Na+ transport system ATPase subunit NatA